MDGWYGRLFEGVGLPMDKPITSFTKKQLDTMLYAEPTKIKVEGINLTFDGHHPARSRSPCCPRTPRRCSRTYVASSSGR